MNNSAKGHRQGSTGRASRGLLGGLLAAAVALSMLPSSALAWWNHDWSFRKQITIDTSAKSGRVHGQFIPQSNADAAKADAAKSK